MLDLLKRIIYLPLISFATEASILYKQNVSDLPKQLERARYMQGENTTFVSETQFLEVMKISDEAYEAEMIFLKTKLKKAIEEGDSRKRIGFQENIDNLRKEQFHKSAFYYTILSKPQRERDIVERVSILKEIWIKAANRK